MHVRLPPPSRRPRNSSRCALPSGRVRGGDATARGLSDLGEQLLGEAAHVAELAQRC